VAQFPDRLVGFCGLNPLTPYALDELARCTRDPHLRNGLKLHFGNSVVDYHDPRHVRQIQRVFRAANQRRMPIVVHMHASVTEKLPYGRDEGLIFLNEMLPAAPDVVVQVAHMAGSGAPGDEGAQQVLDLLADAIARRDRRTRHLYFDITAVGDRVSPDDARRWAARIRQVGMARLLFGSDAVGVPYGPADAWTTLRRVLPLTDGEFGALAANAAPYLQ
jgi:predicted TIM-barrel fold metal-dependent hydrolase